MSLQNKILGWIWVIENNVLRRAVMFAAFPVIAIGRVIQTIILIPIVILLTVVIGLKDMAAELGRSLTDWSGEGRQWAVLPRAWRLIWETDYAHRFIPVLATKKPRAPATPAPQGE